MQKLLSRFQGQIVTSKHGCMTEAQQLNVQKAFLAFHKKHDEYLRPLSDREVPMYEISCQVCDWTEEIRINSGMNIGRRLASKRHFDYSQTKRRLRNKTCPVCKETKGIRKIIWGMPAGEPDESIYYIGGCTSEDFSTIHKCIDCGWEGK